MVQLELCACVLRKLDREAEVIMCPYVIIVLSCFLAQSPPPVKENPTNDVLSQEEE